ncbi:DUF350 domain-containing protein [Vibrio antiquarius]|uniref:DUF350 domain-containing protein n=1 Tax=Vibrio parahaemolyticus TaxID=670 RepID=A0AA46UQP1_VIBPH|nr:MULTISPECIES: DUF350 domain-containing protein [Vibrio harveyi group]KOE82502.1 hypothetical protein ACS91_20830 [Vibrio parahaemolyticus]MCS0310876.1 DUF350 domain-containing protein [Vibrio diabolicus]UYV29849.1 DUF350 domain-containing protein [Vibrio parahaemolyticus]UYW19110.1 DUF350 domain-containing protein [Vibrio parahaemolyticus]
MVQFISEDFSITASLMGLVPFGIYLGISFLMVFFFLFLYKAITPYNEIELIRNKSQAAAISLGGALIGFSIPLTTSMEQSVNIADFLIWGAISASVQILTFCFVRILVGDIGNRMKNNEIGTGIILAASSITMGMLNASAATY